MTRVVVTAKLVNNAQSVPPLHLNLEQNGSIKHLTALAAGQLKLEAKGGAAPFTYSMSGLPAGWSLNTATGDITGTSSAAIGHYVVTASATDSSTNTVGPLQFSISIISRLTVVAGSPPPAENSNYYVGGVAGGAGYQFQVGNALGAVTWAVTSGSLPTGLILSSAGLLHSNLPVTAIGGSTYSFIATATDAGSGDTLDISCVVPVVAQGVVTFDNTVSPAPTGQGGTYLPPVIIGQPYKATVTVAGGIPPFRFYDNNGALASFGLVVEASTGIVTGTVTDPTTSGDFVGYGYDNPVLVEVNATESNIPSAYGGTATTAQAALVFIVPNHSLQIASGGGAVGEPGIVTLNFEGGPTVTDDGDGVRRVTFGSASTLTTDTDGTLAANSDSRVATQKATKTYVDNAVTGLFDFKGSNNCSSNPNYPAALKGDAYVVSTAGKIGGASGTAVDIGDVYVASADNAGGTQAAVGASWFILEHNLAGALLGASNLSDVASAVAALDNLTKQSADIASASTTDLSTATGRNVNVTGTTTITALGTIAAGIERVTRFAGILQLTYNATSLILTTAANITTAAGDQCGWISLGSGNWRMQWYSRADGSALVGSGGLTLAQARNTIALRAY